VTIVIFGAGYIGERLARQLPGAVLSRADVTRKDEVLRALRDARADAVINAAGKTGRPNVDWCESHQAETYRANVTGALAVADACAEAGAYLLHLGSGCIYYGPSPSPGGWLEDDHGNPSAFYSRTKYAADLVLSRLPNVGIARLRMPVDDVPGPRNLITKLSRYAEVIDVENSVTVVPDMVKVVGRLVEARATGVFHVVNPGPMRHRDLLALYREIVDPSHRTTLIGEAELVARGLAVKARSNCLLQSPRLAALGITMRPIEVALRETMERYARAFASAGSTP
jgi:dTDP-4-dehydrorhamnose reductase